MSEFIFDRGRSIAGLITIVFLLLCGQSHAIRLQGSVQFEPGINAITIPFDLSQSPTVEQWMAFLGGSGIVTAVQGVDASGSIVTCAYDQSGIATGNACGIFVLPGTGWLVYSSQAHSVNYDNFLTCPGLDLLAGVNFAAIPCATLTLSSHAVLGNLNAPNIIATIQTFDTTTGRWLSAGYDASGLPYGPDFKITGKEDLLIHAHQATPPPLPIDTDGDGLIDSLEDVLGTAPDKIDTDGDGTPDEYEIESRTDPLVPTPYLFASLSSDLVKLVTGQVSTTETLSVQNFSAQSVNWAMSADVPWLAFMPASGSLGPNTTAFATIGIDAANLAPGSYNAQISKKNVNAFLIPAFLPMNLLVFSNTGRGNFFAGDLNTSDSLLEQELLADPSDQEIHFLHALTSVLQHAVPPSAQGSSASLAGTQQASPQAITVSQNLRTFLSGFGFTILGSDLSNFGFDYQTNANGGIQLPDTSPTAEETTEFLRTDVLPGLLVAINMDLSVIDPAFQMVLNQNELQALGIFNQTSLEIDYGDAKMLEAALRVIVAAIQILVAYDLDFDVDEAVNQGDDLPLQTNVVNANPLFGTMQVGGDVRLSNAKLHLLTAIDLYVTASDSIQAETDPQGDDLLIVTPGNLTVDAKLRTKLNDIKTAIGGPSPVEGEILDLGLFFDTPFDLRPLLPTITFDPAFRNKNCILPGAFPDPTFNGTAPNMTSTRLAGFRECRP